MVFRNERRLLESAAEVVCFVRNNDDIDESSAAKKVQLALNAAWSAQTYREIASLVRSTRPDVAHFHNTFPQISPSAYAACRDNGVPVVQTLHNYRLVCPNALLMRDGAPCEECLGPGKTLLPALRHRCYRGALLATGAQVWSLTRNRWRGSYRRLVDRYIALTDFAAGKLTQGGLPAERIAIKPNFLPCIPNVGQGAGGYAIFVGRLSPEKGVATLVRAWRQLRHLPLKIVGDGVLRSELEQSVSTHRLPVEFLGLRAASEIPALVGHALFQVIPSEWYEGFPMVVLEAYASGTPVVASRIGSLDEIVHEGKTGAKFRPGDAADLVEKIKGLLEGNALHAMRPRVRRQFEEKYTAERNISQLLEIYEHAIDDFRARS
jgi:glycosyltransferase involved in cell wall biosynthesis